MSKEPEDEEFSFEDYEETEDEGLDLPDLEEELGSLKDEETEEEEQITTDEEPEEQEIAAKEEVETEKEAEPTPTPKEKPALTAAPAPEAISRDDLTFAVSIEVGRVNISMAKLLELKEGNLLELGVSPDSGVDLVVHGKCVGKGELLKVGDTIGVRILQLS